MFHQNNPIVNDPLFSYFTTILILEDSNLPLAIKMARNLNFYPLTLICINFFIIFIYLFFFFHIKVNSIAIEYEVIEQN